MIFKISLTVWREQPPSIPNQAVKQFDHEAPRIDLRGEDTCPKAWKKLRSSRVLVTLYLLPPASNLISNAA
jgi:hypothetical protein